MMELRNRQRGDTILEVMICVAVVGLLLSAAFALSNRNTTAELMAQERSVGVKIAESQLELLKSYADQHKLPDRNMLFCMNSDPASPTGVRPTELTGDASPNPDKEADIETEYPDACRQQESSFAYEFAIWSPNHSGQIGGTPSIPYAVTVRWDAANAGERQEVKIFYNLYDSSNPEFAVDGLPPRQCSNTIDDDDTEDTAADWPADAGCTSAADDDETNPECNNFRDDDDDGKIDYGSTPGNDRGCSNLQDDTESPDPPPILDLFINGKDYSACVEAEGLWNDGLDRCFTTGNSMYTWREVRVTYPTSGLTPGPATLEIKYQEYNLSAPAGYTSYDFDIAFSGSTTNHLLPVSPPGVQRTYTIPVNISDPVPGSISLEWRNNIGNDPDVQIDSIRIYRP